MRRRGDEPWSSSSDEAGNESDDGVGPLPQSHTDVRRLRLEERRLKPRPSVDGPGPTPLFVPKLAIDRGFLGRAAQPSSPSTASRPGATSSTTRRASSGSGCRARSCRPFLDRVCARGTLSSSAEGWSQETANSTPTMQIVGMWNPAEGTGYEPPGVIHPLDVLFIANGEEDMRRITELATTHMQREEFLAGEFTLAKVVERKGDFLETGLTSVDEAIAKEKAGDLDVMAEFEEKARLAARSNNLETLERMVDDQKVDKDTADRKGNTLLILAAQQGDKKICKYLLRRGANINKTNFAGNSVLHYCYEYNRDDLLEYLRASAPTTPSRTAWASRAAAGLLPPSRGYGRCDRARAHARAHAAERASQRPRRGGTDPWRSSVGCAPIAARAQPA